jgi:hypothetical protein
MRGGSGHTAFEAATDFIGKPELRDAVRSAFISAGVTTSASRERTCG